MQRSLFSLLRAGTHCAVQKKICKELNINTHWKYFLKFCTRLTVKFWLFSLTDFEPNVKCVKRGPRAEARSVVHATLFYWVLEQVVYSHCLPSLLSSKKLGYKRGVFGQDRFNGLTDYTTTAKSFRTRYKIISIWIFRIFAKLLRQFNYSVSLYEWEGVFTYCDDDEVQPTPGVCEVLLEAVRRLFDQHLNDEDHRERTIHLLHRSLQHPPLLQIFVLDRLSRMQEVKPS